MINEVFHGDNLAIMRSLPPASIDMIYIDPPYFTRQDFKRDGVGFSDKYKNLQTYIDFINLRLVEIKRLLKSSGTVFVHLDWRASHYVKCDMDKVFGYNNFVNEIIWCYGSVPHGNVANSFFPRKHDSIFLYSKTKKYNIENK